MTGALVLVTGGSGFLGAHCIIKLLGAGYAVRTSVRSLSREPEVRAMLAAAGVDAGERLSFAAADLTRDEGWAEAAAGCAYVLHVASPFPLRVPRDAQELIRPAREGALRVLKAARDAGARRLVLTSSFAAVGYGIPTRATPFNEEDWTNPDAPGVMPYIKSKALAERAAWDFMAREGGAMELATVNPVAILGPVLGKDYSASIALVDKLLTGSMPGCPRVAFGIVDVRDVADLHVLAMTAPAAAGQRFLAISGAAMWVREIAQTLKDKLGAEAARVPTSELPNWAVRLAAMLDPSARQLIPELGRYKSASSEKAQRMLGWAPRSREDAVLASAESLLRLGLVKGGAKSA